MCSKRGIAYDTVTKLSGGKTQWQNAKNQFLASFKLALSTGEWDNNVSRANESADTTTDTAEPKEKSKKGTRAPSVIDVKKIAEGLNNKLSRAQTLELMELLCDEISDKNTTYVVSKH
jgi:catalase (peroxidase I)